MIYRGKGFNRFPTLNWAVYPVESTDQMGFALQLEIQRPNASLPVFAQIPGDVVQAMIHLHAHKQGDIAIQKVSARGGTWKVTDAPEGMVLRADDELFGFNVNEVRGIMKWLMYAEKGDEGIIFTESPHATVSTAIN